MKIAFLGGCQAGAYKHIIDASGQSGFDVENYEIFQYRREQFDELYEKVVSADVVVTVPISQAQGPFWTDNLRKDAKNVVVITRIYFQGFHPDCIYMGPSGLGRWTSPIGIAHSHTVYECWKRGLSADNCVGKLSELSPALIKRIYKESTQELIDREKTVDVAASRLILDAPEHSWRHLHTFNHPSTELLTSYLLEIFRYMGVSFKAPSTCSDLLGATSRFPVYPTVLDALDIPHSSKFEDITFGSGIRELSISEFAEASYQEYDKLFQTYSTRMFEIEGLPKRSVYTTETPRAAKKARGKNKISKVATVGFPQCIPAAFSEILRVGFGAVCHKNPTTGSVEYPALADKDAYVASSFSAENSGAISALQFSQGIYSESAVQLMSSLPSRKRNGILYVVFLQDPLVSLISWYKLHKSIALAKKPEGHFAAVDSEFYSNCSINEYYERWAKSRLRYSFYLERLFKQLPKECLLILDTKQFDRHPEQCVMRIGARLGLFPNMQSLAESGLLQIKGSPSGVSIPGEISSQTISALQNERNRMEEILNKDSRRDILIGRGKFYESIHNRPTK